MVKCSVSFKCWYISVAEMEEFKKETLSERATRRAKELAGAYALEADKRSIRIQLERCYGTLHFLEDHILDVDHSWVTGDEAPVGAKPKEAILGEALTEMKRLRERVETLNVAAQYGWQIADKYESLGNNSSVTDTKRLLSARQLVDKDREKFSASAVGVKYVL